MVFGDGGRNQPECSLSTYNPALQIQIQTVYVIQGNVHGSFPSATIRFSMYAAAYTARVRIDS